MHSLVDPSSPRAHAQPILPTLLHTLYIPFIPPFYSPVLTDSVSPVRVPQSIFFSSKMDNERSRDSPSILPIPPPADFQIIPAGINTNPGSTVSTVSTQQGVSMGSALPAGQQPPLIPMASMASTVSTVSTNSGTGVSTVSGVSGIHSTAGSTHLDSVVSPVTPIPPSLLGGGSVLAGKEGMGEETGQRGSVRPSTVPASVSTSASLNASNPMGPMNSMNSMSSLGPLGPLGSLNASGPSSAVNGLGGLSGSGGGEGGEKAEEGSEWKELMGNVGMEGGIECRWIRSCLRVL